MVKMMNSTTKPGASSSGTTLCCRAWGTEGGCRFGRDCKFTHDWAGLEDKSSRCWICSGVGHQKALCPFRRTEGGASGGSGSPGVVETSNKNGKGQKGKGKTKDSPEKGEKGKGGKPSPNTPPKVQAAQKEEEKPATSSTSSRCSRRSRSTSFREWFQRRQSGMMIQVSSFHGIVAVEEGIRRQRGLFCISTVDQMRSIGWRRLEE